MQLSDIIKKLEDECLISSVDICNNYDDGSPELHLCFYDGEKAKNIIKSFDVYGITESGKCPYWE